MKRIFFKKLTIDELKKYHITNCTEDGKIFIDGIEATQTKTPSAYSGKYYYTIQAYKRNKNDEIIKKPVKCKYKTKSGEIHESDSYIFENKTFGVHRLVYLWNKNKEDPTFTELPAGYHVDHKDNIVEHNYYDNLQLLPAAENLAKDRKPSTYKARMPQRKIYDEDYLIAKISDCEAEIQYYKDIRTDDNYKIIHKKLHSSYAKLAQWKNRLEQFLGNK